MIVDVQLRQEIQNRDIWLCDAQGNRYDMATGRRVHAGRAGL